ncbi:MAG: methyl-accepting chemotaxis protein [Planctomycetes bacterium]|nr:methyl-accepting chemotaxis protein [Planctomycetota bacterium]
MNLRTRLTALLMLCAAVPMTVTVTVSSVQSRHGTSELVRHASEAVQARAKEQLSGLMAARTNHVLHYFGSTAELVGSLARDGMYVQALSGFAESFPAIAADNQIDDGAQATWRSAVGSYYTREFGSEYLRQNPGHSSPGDMLFGRIDAATVAAQKLYVIDNPNPLGKKDGFDRASDKSRYTELHASVHPAIHELQRRFGLHDLFLIDHITGRVVYTVFKELDFGTSLNDGPFRDSNLAELYRRLRNAGDGEVAMVDYARCPASYDAPASFLGAPISLDGKRLGYVAVQLPIDRVNAVMTARDGLGETGEIVLVGSDGLMRSDSRHLPETHNVVASFRDPQKGRLELPLIKAAIAGDKPVAAVIEDVDGGVEVAVATPVQVMGNRWCMLAKIEEQEIFAVARAMEAEAAEVEAAMLAWSLGLILGTAVVMFGIAWWQSRQVVQPIQGTIVALKDIAEGEGDLTRRLDEQRADELGELGRWFNKFLVKLQGVVQQIAGKAQGVTAASTQLQGTATSLTLGAERTKSQSTQVAAAAEQMSANMNTVSTSSEGMAGTFRAVAAAVEEMTASIGEVAKNAENAARVAGQAAQLTRSSNEKVSALGSAANEIGRVIETIQDIAEQTNLLALNATIEAARAGEAGKGFSVVANEVKDLARQTAEATQDIRQRIERIQASTGESVAAIGEIDKVIAQVSSVSQTIAVAVAEQRTATQEISQNLAQNTRTVEVVNRNVAESVAASQEISKSIAEVDSHARSTAAGAEQTLASGRGLAGLAGELSELVGRFKV